MPLSVQAALLFVTFDTSPMSMCLCDALERFPALVLPGDPGHLRDFTR